MRLEIYDVNKLNFVELNVVGDNDNYLPLDENSKFIDAEVFNLFTDAFENANKLYEYFGPTKYNSRKIVPLRNALISTVESFKKIQSKTDFIEHIGNIFLGKEFILGLERQDKSWEDNWESYQIKLIEINQGLINIVEDCIENEKILWVIGY
ncbi:MAG: hypothetical protein ACOC3T_01665 [Bacteroidota bacterium]